MIFAVQYWDYGQCISQATFYVPTGPFIWFLRKSLLTKKLYSINPHEKKNDGTSKHKVKLITLVHILVYVAIKMKEGRRRKESLDSSFSHTERFFVLVRTFGMMFRGMQSVSGLRKSQEHQSLKVSSHLASVPPL